MNKQDFLNKLKEDLSSLTDEEMQNALKYYDEYFADAHEEDVERQLEEYNLAEDFKEASENGAADLREPVRPAPEIKRESAGPENNNNVREIKKLKKQKSLMLIVLLICFSPIWIPVAVTVACALFALLMAFLSLSIAMGCVAISGLVVAGGGVFSAGYGIVQLFLMNISGGLLAISGGLVSAGVGIILAYLFGKIAFILFKYEFKFLGFIGKKMFKPAHQNN